MLVLIGLLALAAAAGTVALLGAAEAWVRGSDVVIMYALAGIVALVAAWAATAGILMRCAG